MASELAVGFVSLLPSTRNFGSNLEKQISGPSAAAGRSSGKRFGDEFSRQASKSTSGLKSTLGSLAKGTGLVAVSAIAAGAGLAAMGIKAAASLETTRTSFASLLGSTKAANVEIAKLQKYAAKTPFSQSDVFGYAQQYYSLADSIGMSKAQLTPFLDAVGNLGAVTGASTENIHNAVLAIGQIGSRGKVTLDNLNQISQAFPGFNGAAAIASATGQTTAQVMNQISKGTLDAKTGVQALIKGMQQFKGASGAMAKQSQTLNGLFSTFKDTISIQLTKAFTPLIPTIKKSLEQLTPAIGQTLKTVAPAIAGFMKNLAPLLVPLTQGLGRVIGAVFDALGPALKALTPLVKPLADAFVLVVNALKPFVTFIAQAVAQFLPPLINMFKIFERTLAPVAKQLFQSLAPVLPIIADALKRLTVALRPVIDALAGAFLQVIQSLGPQLPGLAKSLGDLAVAAVQLIAPLSPLIKLFGLLVGLLSKGVVKYLELAVKWMTAEINAIKDLLGWIGKIGDVGHSITSSIDFLGNALSNVDVAVQQSGLHFDKLTGTFQTVGAAAAGAGNGMNILKVAAGGIGAIAGPLSGAFNAVSGAIGAVSGNIKTLLTNASTALSVLGGLGIPGISAAAGAAGALAAAAAGINTGVATGGGGGFSVPTGGGSGGGSHSSGSKPPKPGKFDRGTLGQLRQALSGDASGIRAAIQSITQSIRQAKKTVPAYLATEGAQLEKLAKQRTAVADRLAKANTALQAVQQKYRDVFTSVSSAVRGTFDISTAGKGFDGNHRVGIGSILAQLRQSVNRAKAFGSLLKRLAKEGLPKGLLLQLAQAGPAALAQAQALAGATPRQLAEIKADFSALTRTATGTGKFLADDLHGSGVKAALGLRDGLKSQKSAITNAIKELGEAMIRQLKRTLKIHSPSRVTHEIGQFLGLGLEHGIVSKYGDVSRAADGLANASRPKLASVRGGGPGAVTFSDADLAKLAGLIGAEFRGVEFKGSMGVSRGDLALIVQTGQNENKARGGGRR